MEVRSRRQRGHPLAAAAGVVAATVLASAGPAAAGSGTALPVPTFGLDPSGLFFDGEGTTASWSNQFVGLTETTFRVDECAPGGLDADHCTTLATVAATNSGSVHVTAHKVVGGAGYTCGMEPGVDQCTVYLISNIGIVKGSEAINFIASK